MYKKHNMQAKKQHLAKKPVKKVAAKPKPHPSKASLSPNFNGLPELKSVDVSGTLSLDNSGLGTGHTVLINGLIPGVERYQRIGRRVTAKSINIRAYIYTSAATPAVIDDLFRFAVVWDEQPTGTLPAASALWQQVTNAGVTSTNMLSLNNRDNSMRFRFLRSHFTPINTETQGLTTNEDRMFWEWNIPLKLVTQYNAGITGGLGDIVTGALYLVAHGNNSAVAQWSVDYSIRFKFFD